MRVLVAVCAAVVLILVAGCGENADQAKPADTETPAAAESATPTGAPPAPSASLATEAVEVTQVDYHGWKALRMTNGLVVLIAVPDIGGRVMEYQLNGRSLLWTNPEEYGHTYPAPKTESERAWHNYGGYKVWPAPQSDWKGPGDPVGSQLDGGKWTAEISATAGQTGEIKLTSPPDPSVTGLQITRRLRLFAGSTRVQVKETLSNVSDHPIRWSAWDVTQVPGTLGDDKTPNEKACIYFPLNPESKLAGGFLRFINDPAGDSQWEAKRELGLMKVSYRHLLGKIGADSMAGWIAFADELHELAFVKRFETEPLGEYPDQGATVEVYTSGTLPYMEVEVLSRLYDLKPGKERTVTREWYAAATPGPVLDATEVGAVREPFRCVVAGDKLKLSGAFGVFVEGSVVLATADADGKVQEEIVSLPASPTTPFVLSKEIAVPKKAAALVLDVANANGSPIGRLARVPLPDNGK